MEKPCPLPGCRIDHVTRLDPHTIGIAAHRPHQEARCPACRHISRAVHSRYSRHPADLPAFGRAVRIRLHVRRFYCRNAACPKRTFAERLPALLAPHAQRTRRLANAQARLGITLGGEAGAKLLPHLAMSASADTVLRLIRAMKLPTAARFGRGRLGAEEGPHLRHDPGRPRAAARPRPPA